MIIMLIECITITSNEHFTLGNLQSILLNMITVVRFSSLLHIVSARVHPLTICTYILLAGAQSRRVENEARTPTREKLIERTNAIVYLSADRR